MTDPPPAKAVSENRRERETFRLVWPFRSTYSPTPDTLVPSQSAHPAASFTN